VAGFAGACMYLCLKNCLVLISMFVLRLKNVILCCAHFVASLTAVAEVVISEAAQILS